MTGLRNSQLEDAKIKVTCKILNMLGTGHEVPGKWEYVLISAGQCRILSIARRCTVFCKGPGNFGDTFRTSYKRSKAGGPYGRYEGKE